VAAVETLYLRAAILNDPNALRKIGEMYLNGQGTPRDPETAWVWLTLAIRTDASKSRSALSLAEEQVPSTRITLLLPRVTQLSDELKRLAVSFKNAEKPDNL